MTDQGTDIVASFDITIDKTSHRVVVDDAGHARFSDGNHPVDEAALRALAGQGNHRGLTVLARFAELLPSAIADGRIDPADTAEHWRLFRDEDPASTLILDHPFDKSVRRALEKRSAPRAVLDQVLANGNGRQRASVAANPTLTPGEITLLVRDKTAVVRAAVAARPDLSQETAALLAQDSSVSVRTALANNARTPGDVLAVLVDSSDWAVAAGAAENPSTPADVLVRLASNNSDDALAVHVRTYAIRNPSLPVETLDRLSRHDDKWIRSETGSSPNASIDLLWRLAKDTDPDVRECLAWVPELPVDILRHLAGDNDPTVAQAAEDELADRT